MGVVDEKAKNIIKQLRHSWLFVSLVATLLLILWTFQIGLIIRFKTFWPGIRHFNHSADAFLHGKIILNKFPSRNVLSHSDASLVKDEVKHNDPALKVVCYLLVNSTKLSAFSDVDSDLCTHINVGFAVVNNGTLAPQEPTDIQAYQSILSLKKKNPGLKVLLSVQDFSGIDAFKNVIATDESRSRFSSEAVKFLVTNGFDGLDVDWEFPSWPTEVPVERTNFSLLLKTFKEEAKKENASLLLTVAAGAPAVILLQCYNVADIAKYVDYVNLMSYDYHLYSALTPVTGPNAPVFPRPGDTTFSATLNTNWSAFHWNFWGMPKEKIIVGVPTYGHSFTLLNENNNGWNAPAVGFGKLGVQGFISYQDACTLVSRPSATHVFDDHYQVPYAYDQNEWISYESPYSIKLKAEFIKRNGYGGGMVFSLNADDAQNVCGSGPFPLSRTLSQALLT